MRLNNFLIFLRSHISFFLGVGQGDIIYNVRRNILAAIPLEKRIAYHLFSIDANPSNVNTIVKLNRKSKWHSQYSPKMGNLKINCSGYNDCLGNSITGLDFNPMGEHIATIDEYGVCLISDVNTAGYSFHLGLKMSDSFPGKLYDLTITSFKQLGLCPSY